MLSMIMERIYRQAEALLVVELSQEKESRLQAEAFLTAERGPTSRLQAQLLDVCVREKMSWEEC